MGSGSQENVSGIAMAMRVAPLSPGRRATHIATRVPTSGYRMLGQVRTKTIPFQAAARTLLSSNVTVIGSILGVTRAPGRRTVAWPASPPRRAA